jgi:ABC-2 type transport system permease protein
VNWAFHFFHLELRKLFTYRTAFWVKFVLGMTTELTVAYYLWGAVFAATGVTTLAGFSFHGLLYYTIFAALSARVIQSLDRGGFIAEDIYQGTLSRFLLYPLPYIGLRYMTYLAQQFVGLAQLALGLFVATRIWPIPPELVITPWTIALGIVTALLSGGFLFLINAALELVAFWQDTVWNLIAMLRFIGALLGGLLIPLALFPEWGRAFAAFTPFPLVFSFPIRCFLGQVGAEEWFRSALALSAWSAALGVLVAWIWRRGTRAYSGVGI